MLTSVLTIVLFIVYLTSTGAFVVALRATIIDIVQATFGVDMSSVMSAQAQATGARLPRVQLRGWVRRWCWTLMCAVNSNPMDFSLAMGIGACTRSCTLPSSSWVSVVRAVAMCVCVGTLQLYWLVIQLGITLTLFHALPFVVFVAVVSSTPGLTTPAVLFLVFETTRTVFIGTYGTVVVRQCLFILLSLVVQLGLWIPLSVDDAAGTVVTVLFMIAALYACLTWFAGNARVFVVAHCVVAVVYVSWVVSNPQDDLPFITLIFLTMVIGCAVKLRREQEHRWATGSDAAPEFVASGANGSVGRVNSSADLSGSAPLATAAAPPRAVRLSPFRPWAPFILLEKDTGRVVVPRHVCLIAILVPVAVGASSLSLSIRCGIIAALLLVCLGIPCARNWPQQRAWWRYYVAVSKWWCVVTLASARARIEWLWLHDQFLARSGISLVLLLLLPLRFAILSPSGGGAAAFAVIVCLLMGALAWARAWHALAARRMVLEAARLRFGSVASPHSACSV